MIVGFGENSVDYVYRLPHYPQPGTTASKIEIRQRDLRLGGQVATTLATCARLGLATRYLGTFGDDHAGTLLRQELVRRGIDVRHAIVRQAPNRYAVILIDEHGDRVVLWQRDARLRVAPEDVRAEWLAGATLVHVDATDEDAALALAAMARDAGLRVTCDIDTVTAKTTALMSVVTHAILAEHVPAELTGESDVERALRRMRRTHAGPIVVTLGARGSAMLDGERFLQVPAYAVDVVDTTGAGDAFRGGFIYALGRGDRPEDLLRFASAAAAVSCGRHGALEGVPTLDEIAYFLSSTNPSGGTMRFSE